jgi:hypothetical protein
MELNSTQIRNIKELGQEVTEALKMALVGFPLREVTNPSARKLLVFQVQASNLRYLSLRD